MYSLSEENIQKQKMSINAVKQRRLLLCLGDRMYNRAAFSFDLYSQDSYQIFLRDVILNFSLTSNFS